MTSLFRALTRDSIPSDVNPLTLEALPQARKNDQVNFGKDILMRVDSTSRWSFRRNIVKAIGDYAPDKDVKIVTVIVSGSNMPDGAKAQESELRHDIMPNLEVHPGHSG